MCPLGMQCLPWTPEWCVRSTVPLELWGVELKLQGVPLGLKCDCAPPELKCAP